MRSAITAEDLEASFHTETDVSTDSDPPLLHPQTHHQRLPPPGFNRPPGPINRPPGHGGPPPPFHQQQQQRSPAGDVLGVQSLANLANLPPTSSPLPMFGGPGLMPGMRPVPPFGAGLGLEGAGLGLGGLALMSPADQSGMRPVWPGAAFLPGPMMSPFGGQDPRQREMMTPWMSLMDPRLPPPASNPLPIPSNSKPNSPETLLDEGSPVTPPHIRNYHFQD